MRFPVQLPAVEFMACERFPLSENQTVSQGLQLSIAHLESPAFGLKRK